MEDIMEKIAEAAKYIRTYLTDIPDVAIILGSGLGSLANEIRDKIEIPYGDIPNFPVGNVEGHGNKLIYGRIYGKTVLAMKGRVHTYEGYTAQDVAFPVRVFALLGISKLIVSNAAGSINKKYKVGDLMIISDHIKLFGDSPLKGQNIGELGERFPNMSEAYSHRLRQLAKEVAKSQKVVLQEGVYAFMPGPQYETPAEIKMLEIIGADAVGMSTVPEVIAAVHSSIEVLGISCITNDTSDVTKLSHEEVVKATDEISDKFSKMIIEIINNI